MIRPSKSVLPFCRRSTLLQRVERLRAQWWRGLFYPFYPFYPFSFSRSARGRDACASRVARVCVFLFSGRTGRTGRTNHVNQNLTSVLPLLKG